MTEHYEVRLRKAVHVFSAGHFITLTDELCEPVHGHNWTVGVDVEGAPDAHGMVVDFLALRDAVTAVLARLDHKMLLPAANPLLTVLTAPGPLGGAETTVTFRDRRRWIGLETTATLAAAGHVIRGGVRVSVDECLGQSAVWERRD